MSSFAAIMDVSSNYQSVLDLNSSIFISAGFTALSIFATPRYNDIVIFKFPDDAFSTCALNIYVLYKQSAFEVCVVFQLIHGELG